MSADPLASTMSARASAAAPPREVVGVFMDEAALRSAADALLIAGFDRSALALLADQKRVEARLGHACNNVAELEDDPGVPTRHYVGIDSRIEGEAAIVGVSVYAASLLAAGIVVATGGSAMETLLAAALAGAAAGFGGYMLVRFLEGRHTRHLMAQIRRGGIPLWVHTDGADQEQRAIDILERHGAEHVHAHARPKADFDTAGGVSHQLSFMRALGL
jgi:hypothetical protein